MRARLTIIAAGLALSLGGAAAAQQGAHRAAVPPGCSDDAGSDRCSPEQHRRMLALYQLEPIERLREHGAQVRRIFYVDGYGRDLIALSFIRPRGGDPAVTVHYPRRDGAAPREPMRALLPASTWQDVLLRTSHFDRRLAPRDPSPTAPDAISICLHGWVSTVEAADPHERESAGTRRAVENACAEGPVAPLATALSNVALPLFPACAALDPERHRGAAGQLAACAMLEGDRLAAAEVMNEAWPLIHADAAEDLSGLRPLFLEEAVLDWNGERHERGGVAEAWLERKLRPMPSGLYVTSYRGQSADRVQVRGILVRRDSETATSEAPVEMTWLRARGFGPRVERITVGAFAAMRAPGTARR